MNYISEKTFIGYSPMAHGSYTISAQRASIVSYNKSASSPIIDLGLLLHSNKLKQIVLNHSFNSSYIQIHGQYLSASSYHETYYYGGSPAYGWSADFNDTIQSKYTQSVISLGYAFQPTYKSVFVSIGLNCSLNLIKVNQGDISQMNGIGWTEDHPGNIPFTETNTRDTTSSFSYVNCNFRFGTGMYIKIKQIGLIPSFYFTPDFSKKNNLYSLSLGIIFNFNKTNAGNY
jgi:hypothetical protein